MELFLFVVGFIAGIAFGTGITVIWYDDEEIEKLMKEKRGK